MNNVFIGPNVLQRQISHPGQDMMSHQQGVMQHPHQQHTSSHPPLQKMNSVPGHVQMAVDTSSSSMNNMGNPLSSSPVGRVAVTANPTPSPQTLPPFSHSMGMSVLGLATSSAYSDGGPLPSIASASYTQDNDLDNVIESLLDIEAKVRSAFIKKR